MMEEEKNNVENSAEPTGDQVADLQSSGDQAADAQPSAAVPLQPDKPLSGKELRRQKKEAAAAQKAEAAAQKAREKAEAEAQKARQKEESLAAKLQRRQEKKEYRQGVRQERGQEIRLLWHLRSCTGIAALCTFFFRLGFRLCFFFRRFFRSLLGFPTLFLGLDDCVFFLVQLCQLGILLFD